MIALRKISIPLYQIHRKMTLLLWLCLLNLGLTVAVLVLAWWLG